LLVLFRTTHKKKQDDIISFEYRNKYWNFSPVAALDVTRTKIPRPWDLDKNEAIYKHFWSAKDKFHALKYEIVVSLGNYCKIIYMSGGFPGAMNDRKVAEENSLHALVGDESYVVDEGYKKFSEPRFLTPRHGNTPEDRRINRAFAYLRQNVERMNNRIKIFRAAATWRGRRHNHSAVMLAICSITNLELEVTPLNGDEPERDAIQI